jgi:hypothetical protein
MMFTRKMGVRAEYREQQRQRVKESDSLSDKFPKLKSLTVDFNFSSPGDVMGSRQLNYVVNIDNAKSVFRIDCPNDECVRGDFDLTKELANAVTKHRSNTTGEISCAGWRSKTTIGTVRCPNSLRYKLRLAYALGRARRHAAT